MSNDELILNTLLELKQDIGILTGSITEVKDAHAERLKSLEDSTTRQWYVHAITLPVIAALHQLASRFGIH
jgi:hypothetical protein